jgi:polar amino acid transport system substrate-binding protein
LSLGTWVGDGELSWGYSQLMKPSLHYFVVTVLVVIGVAASSAAVSAQQAVPAVAEAPAASEAPAAAARQTIRVATKPFEPFVYLPAKGGGAFSGFSVELWEKIARELDVDTEMYGTKTVSDLLAQVHTHKAEVAIAAITITAAREREADFSHPYFESGLRIMVPGGHEGSFTDLISSILSPALLQVFGFLLLLIVIAAHFLWFFERRSNPEMFPASYVRGIWEAIWWAAVTATTVGYGDRTPSGIAGRIVALVWMFSGIILISFFTATVTSALTVKQIEGTISSPGDLVGRMVGTAAGSTTVKFLEKQAVRVAEYDNIKDAYVALEQGELDAVVYDWPNLAHYAKGEGRGKVQVVGEVFQKQSYGIALPNGSPYRERINRALLQLKEKGVYQDVYDSWFALDP